MRVGSRGNVLSSRRSTPTSVTLWRWLWLPIALAVAGCADVWGFADLTLAPDGAAPTDAVGATKPTPDGGTDATLAEAATDRDAPVEPDGEPDGDSAPDANGCKVALTTVANCGACGRACDEKTSMSASCSNGGCTYSGCAPGWVNCFSQPPDTNGCESSLSSVSTCGGCSTACDTKTGTPRCDGKTCSYACKAGSSDCNGAKAPDTDGCECPTPSCCATKCETVHANGVGKPFYDCINAGTYNMDQAKEACEASAGAGNCSPSSHCCLLSALGGCVGTTAQSVCGIVGGACDCWQYGGNLPGTVQTESPSSCAASCGTSNDPTWN